MIKSKLVDGLDPEQQKQQAIRQVPLFTDAITKEHGLMYLNTDTWKLVAQQILTQKRVDKLVNIDDALTLSILDKAALPKR